MAKRFVIRSEWEKEEPPVEWWLEMLDKEIVLKAKSDHLYWDVLYIRPGQQILLASAIGNSVGITLGPKGHPLVEFD